MLQWSSQIPEVNLTATTFRPEQKRKLQLTEETQEWRLISEVRLIHPEKAFFQVIASKEIIQIT